MQVPEFDSAHALRLHYKAVQARLANSGPVVPKKTQTRSVPVPARPRKVVLMKLPVARTKPVDVVPAPVVRDWMFLDPVPHGEITLADIIRACSCVYQVPVLHIKSPRRNANIVLPRQIFYYFAKLMTKQSLPAIGRFCGGRDHTTVLYGADKIAKKLRELSPRCPQQIIQIRDILMSKPVATTQEQV